jgi:hypothetical protein
MAGVSHDPARAGTSGYWGGLSAFDAGFDVHHDGGHGHGEWAYRADVLNGAVGARAVDDRSASDRGLRVGASVGASAVGLRWYNQDSDGDERREYGLGLSTPSPLGVSGSIDYTTETPIGDLVSLACPISLPIQAAMVMFGAEEYTPAVQIQRAADRMWETERPTRLTSHE